MIGYFVYLAVVAVFFQRSNTKKIVTVAQPSA
jgi:hypothetical protein